MPLVNVLINSTTAGGAGTRGFRRGNAPAPPSLSIDYLIVGGGGGSTQDGGSSGAVVSGSANITFNSTLLASVGLGGDSSLPDKNGQSSSLSGSTFGFVETPENPFGPGLSGPYPIGNGGGAGSSQDGVDGIEGLSGRGGSGSLWLNGIYYAGGGGGAEKDPGVGAGAGMDGGGNGEGYNSLPASNGTPNTGGGAGGGAATGGSGVVIIRYSTGSVNPPYDNAISGGELTISGGYYYHTFTGSGELTYRF